MVLRKEGVEQDELGEISEAIGGQEHQSKFVEKTDLGIAVEQCTLVPGCKMEHLKRSGE